MRAEFHGSRGRETRAADTALREFAKFFMEIRRASVVCTSHHHVHVTAAALTTSTVFAIATAPGCDAFGCAV